VCICFTFHLTVLVLVLILKELVLVLVLVLLVLITGLEEGRNVKVICWIRLSEWQYCHFILFYSKYPVSWRQMVVVQASDDYIIHHGADNSEIVLFLFSGSSGIGAAKKKVRRDLYDNSHTVTRPSVCCMWKYCTAGLTGWRQLCTVVGVKIQKVGNTEWKCEKVL